MRHFGALLAALALCLVAPLAAAPAQNLVVQSATEPPGLDLTATPASATAMVVFYNVQESLVKVDRHGKIVPWLAERWHTSDNRNYTFFLKRGVRFHNGRGHRALQARGVGARRPHRAREESGLSREGAAEARPGDVPLHPRPERGAGRAQGGRYRRRDVRSRPRARPGAPEGPAVPGDHR